LLLDIVVHFSIHTMIKMFLPVLLAPLELTFWNHV